MLLCYIDAYTSFLLGAVLVTGSNPNADYNVGPNVKYPTEYRVERFYPSYYNQRRPEPQGLPDTLTYGGAYFNVTLSKDDLFGSTSNAASAKVVIIRCGFSTHAMVRLVHMQHGFCNSPLDVYRTWARDMFS